MIKKTNKELSVEHETDIAKWYMGKRSASSGAQDADRGDVRFEIGVDINSDGEWCDIYKYTGECKATRANSISINLDVWKKITQEAAEQDRRPCLFLRFYDNGSGRKVDLVVRDINDDREMLL